MRMRARPRTCDFFELSSCSCSKRKEFESFVHTPEEYRTEISHG